MRAENKPVRAEKRNEMRLFNLKTNHLTNPMGYRIGRPTFTWLAESEGEKLSWARIELASDPDFARIVYDSGKREDLSCTGFDADFEAAPRTRYFWRVSAAADNGDTGVSETAWFETALPKDGWVAKWIKPSFDKEIHPVFQKSFTLPEGAVSARAYACGLGIYELSVNGEKAGDEYLLPGYHAYDSWQQYQTFDLTHLLHAGENVISAALGNGWYKGRFGFGKEIGERYGSEFRFICQVEVTFKDGSKTVIATGEDWGCRNGNCLKSNIYDGEYTDGSMELCGLNEFGGETGSDWTPAQLAQMGTEQLSARLSPPIAAQEAFKVAEVIHTPAGETVFDFGQEVTGWVEFVCRAKKGETVTLKYGELLQDGNFCQTNLRTAKATFTYVSSGKNETVRPRFTFFGFRYLKVEGLEAPDPADFTACVLGSLLDRIGTIETSSPLVNRLFLNSVWGQKGNFLDVPTDCPQRDERLGWTGDAQVFCATACMNLDSASFYDKYMQDMYFEQKMLKGRVPHVIPAFKVEDGKPFAGADSAAWADVATVLPWTLYTMTGDKTQLAAHYPCMKMWIDKLYEYDEENGGNRLRQHGGHYGDWLALDNYKNPKSCDGGTDKFYIASAYYAYSADLTARAAEVLGKAEDAAYYRNLEKEVKAAIRKEYFAPNGRCVTDTQTAYVVALYMDLTPAELKPRLVEELRKKLEANDMKLTTGFVGTAYLCRVLTQYGLNDIAYKLLLNEEMPGWLYEVKMGATTVWERWNSILPDGHLSDISMNSLNHYAYGAIAEWMYRWMCGLNPMEEAPGFAKAKLTPRPGEGLNDAKASVRTASGVYESGWERKADGSIAYRFRVPFNCEAILELPESASAEVDGKAVLGAVTLKPGVHTAVTR